MGAVGAGAALVNFNKRHNKAHRWLCETQEDPRLRDLLRSIPAGIVGGLGRARRAWMVLNAQCTEPITDDEIEDLKTEWNQAGIKATVGLSEGSVTDLDRALSMISVRIPAGPARPTEADACIKILRCLIKDSPDEMSLNVLKELQAQGAARQYVHAGTFNRSRVAIVSAYDQVWRSLFKQGKVKKAPAESSTTLVTIAGNALSSEQLQS